MNMRSSGHINFGFNRRVNYGAVKRVITFLPLVISIILFAGCTAAIPDNSDRISSPLNQSSPLEGTWKLESCLSGDDSTVETDVKGNGQKGGIIGFSADSMIYEGNLLSRVSYKVKRVNAREYFLHKAQDLLTDLQLNDSEIFIISAYTEDNFLFEFIKDNQGRIIANLDEQYYLMKKISDKITEAGNTITSTMERADGEKAGKSSQLLRSGILLGVRTPVQTKDGLGDYTYGTFWISSVDRTLQPVMYADDIYLPRKDGFWRFQVKKKLGNEGIEDYLFASKEPVLKASNATSDDFKSYNMKTKNSSNRIETKLRKAVQYIGNDYVCIENIVYTKQKDGTPDSSIKTLRTLPVDNLDSIEGIKISDMAGENGLMTMENAISNLRDNGTVPLSQSMTQDNWTGSLSQKTGEIGIRNLSAYAGDIQEMNFSLFRKTGHWFFKGRLNLDPESQLPYVDFNLNIIPPADMVAYDILQVPWTDMKDKLPQAADIYTSPNNDLAVILTQNEILLYSIENKTLSDTPLGKFTLKDGSSVIMAEWALGDYVPVWDKSFVKNNDITMVENTLH